MICGTDIAAAIHCFDKYIILIIERKLCLSCFHVFKLPLNAVSLSTQLHLGSWFTLVPLLCTKDKKKKIDTTHIINMIQKHGAPARLAVGFK